MPDPTTSADDRIAIYSDIHGNLEAAQAVLENIRSLGIPKAICLGDTVGYGGDPVACLLAVQASGHDVIQGNHDAAAAGTRDISDFNPNARAGIAFAKKTLSSEQVKYLRNLPLIIQGERFTAVHASLNEPEEWHYIFDDADADLHFKCQTQPVCFIGHTHVPRIWSRDGRSPSPRANGSLRLHPDEFYCINVGSVGQPRDNDPRASYVIFQSSTMEVTFQRITYDVAGAQKKIREARLPHFLAQRLLLGR
jgi:diadenosine tetraphosphatase ApaH/serine/threonine PP2A family protein phosphatase